jgi:hypothetical protein
MWEERRLRVFENRALRRIFGPKRDEVTREWRKLHNEEFYGLYSSLTNCAGDKTEKNEMGGKYSSDGRGEKCVCRVLVGKSEGKRPQEMGCGGGGDGLD